MSKNNIVYKIMNDQDYLSSIGTIGEKWDFVYHKDKKTDYLVSNNGRIKSNISGIILSISFNKYGYAKFNLCFDGYKYTKTIHRLVAESFIPNDDPKTKTYINHIDGNKQNNHYTNLEWVTAKENIRHAISTGLAMRDGVGNPNNKYTIEQIHQVCKLLEDGKDSLEISKLLNVNKSLGENIKRGKLWQDIAKNYNIPKPVSKLRSDELKNNITKLIHDGFTNREIVQKTGLPDTEFEREYISLFRRRLLKRSTTTESKT